ncbi:MAG TPA: NAD(P)-dependent alcohol dehydrogenase [Pyrinomonadaceae bacterium]|nr:NAD(P)-dependent alcohol dehydrogenase [Pyrinomonadaceae bacterium]
MIETNGYAVHEAGTDFKSFNFERRDVGPHDILIDILYAGICHSDIHQAKDEWHDSMPTTYPLVPGHEIVGRVSQIGSDVTKFKVGDIAGIGCFIDSCRECPNCKNGQEQFCFQGAVFTYNGIERDGVTRTYGGYSKNYVINENYALKVNFDGDLSGVAPLLCAGITTFSPLRRFKVGPGQKVGVVGLGGLGHMGVKLAKAMGAEVTIFSTSPKKEADAKSLGADHFVVTSDPANLAPLTGTFNFILDTVSADHDVNPYINLLGVGGAMVVVGVPGMPNTVHNLSLIFGNKSLSGSLIGGIPETQEMLDFCAEHNIVSDVEVISPEYIPEAYDRTVKSDVRYRFVIDMKNA